MLKIAISTPKGLVLIISLSRCMYVCIVCAQNNCSDNQSSTLVLQLLKASTIQTRLVHANPQFAESTDKAGYIIVNSSRIYIVTILKAKWGLLNALKCNLEIN